MKQNQKSSGNNPYIDPGRVFPRETDFEKSVLCTLLQEPGAYPLVCETLTRESFYEKPHELIYSAIAELHAGNHPAGMIDAVERLRQRGELEQAGGASHIASLATAGIPNIREIGYRARIIAQKHLARQLIVLTAEIQARCFDETQDIAETLEELETRLTQITASHTGTESIEMGEAVTAAIERAAKIQEDHQNGRTVSIPTGIDALNREFYGGWKAPDLIILAARPSMGKTQLAVHFAKSAAQAGKEILFISIEMTGTQLVNRLLLEDERISAYNLATGQMSQEEWLALDKRAGEIWNLKIHIAAKPGIRKLENICSEARRLKRKKKLDMVIIDYLGLIQVSGKFERRQLEIARITGTLKNLAKELDVPVMLLSQLNRPEKGAAIREPQLHDLRESGDIEQDADAVLFIHRPSYYDKDKHPEWENRGKIIIGKYREGARNRSVVFCHDRSFKKVWGKEEEPLSPGNFRPVDFSEPARKDEDMPF